MTKLNEIVSLLHYGDKILCATKHAVFDITDAANPVPLTNIDIMNKMEMGYEYDVLPVKKEWL